MLDHFYLVGAQVFADGITVGNHYISAQLHAPASVGLTNTTGDYNKQALGGGMNMIVPVSEGTGSWSMDLDAKQANTNILKATPVPVAGNNGWFDYDKDTNILTRNMDQEGGYNLYDFGIPIHHFARRAWIHDGFAKVTAEGTVAKQLFNFWQIKFELNTSLLGPTATVLLEVATKKNV